MNAKCETVKNTVLCPSAPMHSGGVLLGIVLADGRVAFAPDRIVVDDEFVETAQHGRPAEKRFRFAGSCVNAACRQWSGSRCGIIDRVLDALPTEEHASELPVCSIRGQCRWFLQRGAAACEVCSLVITDSRPDSKP